MKVSLLIMAAISLPITASAASQPSEAEQVQKIQSLPPERCQKDLQQLRFIYGQLQQMSRSDGEVFLERVAENIRNQGISLPPPPKPCSSVHLALENRCGNVAEVESKCRLVSQ